MTPSVGPHAHGYVCATCQRGVTSGLTGTSALRRANNHATDHRGHLVFMLAEGVSDLTVIIDPENRLTFESLDDAS